MKEIENAAGKFLDPARIIAQLEIAQGATVVDFGCGPGYFTFPFAEIVGKDGLVYSFDILPQIIEAVAGKAKLAGVVNIITRRVNLENPGGTKLQDGCSDWVVLKDIIFQNKKKQEIIKEAYRVLKPGGRALFIEWNEFNLTIGPSLELRINKKELEKMVLQEAFLIEKPIEAGNFHFAFVAKK